MNSLPPEVQFDVFKCLNFDQLFSVKQTNHYFKNFIDKYENELARLKFEKLSIYNWSYNKKFNSYKVIPIESGFFEFNLNAQLKEKWQKAIDKSIPLYLLDYRPRSQSAVILDHYILKLPNFPKNIKEMIILRCWFEHLFKCAFEYTGFDNLFNPKIINLLFDNDKTIPLQFHIQKPSLFARHNMFENFFNFASNHLSISESLSINYSEDDISEQQINILFDIIINGGMKLPQFYFKSNKCFKLSRLYDLIFKHITTSTNCTKMVPVILLEYISNSNFKLSRKAKNVEIKKLNVVKYTKYKISNIHNPKVKFSFCNAERIVHANFGMNSNFKFKIRIMKV
ncbi:unnamed protein product [Meloidogyne enterolobii]|uniref:Uncharacterized protein n=1 Tax=Meloidogyne enterolobii TaxID=390850 RepID=A0ACB0YP54_MELEN